MATKSSPKADKVWAYLINNKTATPAQVAKATGVSYGYAYKLMQKIEHTERGVYRRGGSEKHRKKATSRQPKTGWWATLRGFIRRALGGNGSMDD